MTEWKWWAGTIGDEMMQVGPCDTRQDAIDEYIDWADHDKVLDRTVSPPVWKYSFYVCEAKNDPILLSDWIDTYDMTDRAEDLLSDSDRVCDEFDRDLVFEWTREQNADLRKRIRDACDDWQKAHGIIFRVNTFSAMRNEEEITVEADQ